MQLFYYKFIITIILILQLKIFRTLHLYRNFIENGTFFFQELPTQSIIQSIFIIISIHENRMFFGFEWSEKCIIFKLCIIPV